MSTFSSLTIEKVVPLARTRNSKEPQQILPVTPKRINYEVPFYEKLDFFDKLRKSGTGDGGRWSPLTQKLGLTFELRPGCRGSLPAPC